MADELTAERPGMCGYCGGGYSRGDRLTRLADGALVHAWPCGAAPAQAALPPAKPLSRHPGRPRELFVYVGDVFGRGRVVNSDVVIPWAQPRPGAELACSCGRTYLATVRQLLDGSVRSCGCSKRDRIAAIAQARRQAAAARLAADAKTCSRCRKPRPLACFAAEPRSADGRRSVCRDCTSAAKRQARAARRVTATRPAE